MTESNELSIRDADLDRDQDALVTVWRDAVEATHHFLTPADIDGYEAVVRRYLPQMPVLRVAVDERDRPVGFIALHEDMIEMLFVSPAQHGRGVGSSLLADAAGERENLRVDVNEQNPSGRAFYERRGFRQVGFSPRDAEGRPFPILHLARTAG